MPNINKLIPSEVANKYLSQRSVLKGAETLRTLMISSRRLIRGILAPPTFRAVCLHTCYMLYVFPHISHMVPFFSLNLSFNIFLFPPFKNIFVLLLKVPVELL